VGCHFKMSDGMFRKGKMMVDNIFILRTIIDLEVQR
jgi:hypothetical protein